MKKHRFIVELEFADDIVADDEIENIASSILDALVHEVNCGNGFAPESSDTYTKSIEVSNNIINSTLRKEL